MLEDLPNHSWGTSVTMAVGSRNAANRCRGIVRFDLSSLTSLRVRSASIGLAMASRASIGSGWTSATAMVYRIADANGDWVETMPTNNPGFLIVFPGLEALNNGPPPGSAARRMPWSSSLRA